PLARRSSTAVSPSPAAARGGREGDIDSVKITRPTIAGRPPWGRVIEVLGQPDTPGIDVEMIVRKHRLPHVFSEAALAEAEAIPETISHENLTGRADLRDWLTVTI